MNRTDQVVVIREADCIGCTKCIPVCPTDAIIGTSGKMHTVITSACIGCELCLPPCPMDCIEIKPVATRSPETKRSLAKTWQTRARARKARLKAAAEKAKQQHTQAKSARNIQAILTRLKKSGPST